MRRRKKEARKGGGEEEEERSEEGKGVKVRKGEGEKRDSPT